MSVTELINAWKQVDEFLGSIDMSLGDYLGDDYEGKIPSIFETIKRLEGLR